MRWPWAQEQRQSSLSEPNQDLIAALGGAVNLSGERVSAESSLRIADVFAAVSIIAETVGTLPLKVYREIGGNVEEQPNHRAAYMLGTAPNPTMPAHRFWATAVGHLLLWGNCFIEKLRNEEGLVDELWLIHPSTVTIEYNETIRQKRYIIGFNQETLSEDRVLHIFGYSSDGLSGLSPIQQCAQQLGMVKARERFEADVYARKPFLSGVVEHPKKLTDTVKLRESWAAIYGGGDRGVRGVSGRMGVAVLEEGAKFTPLTAPLADMQFVEQQQMSKRTIASIFKLPPSYLGGSTGDSLTYQTVESNKIQLATMAIAPVTVNLQKFLGFDRGLFPFPSWYPEFPLEAMMRGDSVARADFYSKMFAIVDAEGKRALDVNEIRGLENRPPASADEATIAAMQQPAPLPAESADAVA